MKPYVRQKREAMPFLSGRFSLMAAAFAAVATSTPRARDERLGGFLFLM